jgi:hypothetical protein
MSATLAARRDGTARRRLDAPMRTDAADRLAGVAALALLALGWWVREERYFDATAGVGYGLGIAGASLMTFLLVYSARKRLGFLRRFGALSRWFRFHMYLGVAGPVAVLFHCNFRLEAINSTIAVASMLLVAGSGFVGRFLYNRIHLGLYGRRAELRELLLELTESRGILRPLLEVFPEVLAVLADFEKRHTAPPAGAFGALLRLCTIGARCRALERRCRSMLPPVLFEERRAAATYVARLRGAASFSAYERLFRLWHALHIPLFYLLVVSVAVHVVAVHLY